MGKDFADASGSLMLFPDQGGILQCVRLAARKICAAQLPDRDAQRRQRPLWGDRTARSFLATPRPMTAGMPFGIPNDIGIRTGTAPPDDIAREHPRAPSEAGRVRPRRRRGTVVPLGVSVHRLQHRSRPKKHIHQVVWRHAEQPGIPLEQPLSDGVAVRASDARYRRIALKFAPGSYTGPLSKSLRDHHRAGRPRPRGRTAASRSGRQESAVSCPKLRRDRQIPRPRPTSRIVLHMSPRRRNAANGNAQAALQRRPAGCPGSLSDG